MSPPAFHLAEKFHQIRFSFMKFGRWLRKQLGLTEILEFGFKLSFSNWFKILEFELNLVVVHSLISNRIWKLKFEIQADMTGLYLPHEFHTFLEPKSVVPPKSFSHSLASLPSLSSLLSLASPFQLTKLIFENIKIRRNWFDSKHSRNWDSRRNQVFDSNKKIPRILEFSWHKTYSAFLACLGHGWVQVPSYFHHPISHPFATPAHMIGLPVELELWHSCKTILVNSF